MILYYTRSQKTKVFAEALHDILRMPIYHLKTDLDSMGNFKFMLRAIGSVFTGKECPVSNMPETLPGEIYLCAPIWGGRIAAPARYFLRHSNLSKTKINILVTASTPVEKYRLRTLEELTAINCIHGERYIFATGNSLPEKDVIIEQMHEMIFGDLT